MKLLKFAFPYTKIVLVDRETKEEKIRYYPYLPCSIEWGGKKSPPTMGLLDSGADGVILPLDLAKSLNLDLAIEKKPMKVVGRMVDRFTAKVNIIIGRGGGQSPFLM